jgi:hypothetical protein
MADAALAAVFWEDINEDDRATNPCASLHLVGGGGAG